MPPLAMARTLVPAESLQLVRRRWAVRVGRHEQRPATLVLEMPGQLGRGGGLSRALQADEQHDCGRAGQAESAIARGKQPDEFLVDDLHDLLAGRQALEDLRTGRALTNPGDEVLHHLEVDVGLQERQPNLAHGGVDVCRADPTAAREGAEGVAQPLAQSVEHGWLGLLIRVAVPRWVWRWAADSGGTESAGSVPHRGWIEQAATCRSDEVMREAASSREPGRG
jgi:hypothetical protein